MTRRFTSTVAGSHDRGVEFGSVHAARVAATATAYDELFVRTGAQAGLDPGAVRALVVGLGAAALERVERWAPRLAREIHGIADGAGLPVTTIAALNARTELLARLTAHTRGECSTVVALGADDQDPVAIQNWDWFGALSDGWLVWEIPHREGGVTTTLTEYGIVGKIGLGRHGLGVLFNILHHACDGVGVGVPVHVAARQLLDTCATVPQALTTLGTAQFSASTTITLVTGRAAGKNAVCAEVWPGGVEVVQPRNGLLLHTNHFLASAAAGGDLEPEQEPDTLDRMAALERQLSGLGADADVTAVRQALCDHGDGPCSLCSHPDPGAPTAEQYSTLATARLDFAARTLDVHAGNPCGELVVANSTFDREASQLAATTD